ncbi:MAG: DUF1492 domain-containing protein [Ruminococcus sp.]|nr:DUF1492 domain-containing protein [Ruminococcus sp.]
MIFIKAKDYLNQVRRVSWIIEAKESELDELKKALHSASLHEVHVKTTSVQDLMKKVDTVLDYQLEIRAEIARLISLKKEIHGKINQLSKPMYVGVLTEYYINGKTWQDIAEGLDLSERHIYRIHGNALNEFRKKFGMD